MVPGTGTALNVATVLVGSGLGVVLRGRLPERVRATVTDGLGLLTLLVAGLQASAITELTPSDVLGRAAVIMVLGAILLGGLVGSLLRVEDRLDAVGAALQRRLAGDADDSDRARFVEGFVVMSLLMCVGPLTILGSLQDGLGEGIELLAIKSTLDGFAALAFASALGWGVAASATTVLVYQGSLTALAVASSGALSDATVASITVVGGLLLVGVALRLLQIRPIPVGDMLPALVAAPLLTAVIQHWR